MLIRSRGADDNVWTYQEFDGEISVSWSRERHALEVSNILRDGDGNIATSMTQQIQCYEADIATAAGWRQVVPDDD